MKRKEGDGGWARKRVEAPGRPWRGVWGERDIYAKRFSLAITDSVDAV